MTVTCPNCDRVRTLAGNRSPGAYRVCRLCITERRPIRAAIRVRQTRAPAPPAPKPAAAPVMVKDGYGQPIGLSVWDGRGPIEPRETGR